MTVQFTPQRNPRVIIIQKLYGKLYNNEENIIEEDNRIAIDAELAKLDHAWERRNISSEEEEEEDPLNELNNEFENFEI